jgi:drug/metabolite transporter (DMT)-like permease
VVRRTATAPRPVAPAMRSTLGGWGRVLGDRPVATGVAGAGCIAFSGVLVRLAEVEPATAAVFRCLYALPVLILLAGRERRRFGARSRRSHVLAAIAGLCFACDLVLWHHAIDAVGAGLATVLGNLQVLVVAVIAWAVLGERPDRSLAVALPIVLGGVVLISGVVGQGAYGDDPALGVLLGALTSIAYAGYILVLRQGASDLRRPAGPLAEATVVAALGAAALGAATGQVSLAPSWPAHGWLVLLALTAQVLGWMLISVSLPRLPAAITSVLLLVQPVCAVGLAAVLLGESPSVAQLAGCALVLAGVVVATAARRRPGPTPAANPSPSAPDPLVDRGEPVRSAAASPA